MELIVHGFPTKLQALQVRSRSYPSPALTTDASQFEWAWQNPHLSRHLHAPLSPSKPVAQFPRTALSNRPQTKVQVLQFMLTVPPWSSFALRVTLFSIEAREWWDAARRLGGVVRTEAGWRKWEKERRGRGEEDAWGSRGEVIDRVVVALCEEGVDGGRLVRLGRGDMQDKICVNDGALARSHSVVAS